MTKKKTTTPTNKDDSAAKVKPAKGRKNKGLTSSADEPIADDETSQGAPLKATMAEQLQAKGAEVPERVNEVEITHEKRPLFCAITKEQALERTDRAWLLKDLVAKEEKAMKTLVDASKQKIKAYETTIEQIEKEVHDRGVTVDVECKIEKNYRLKQYVVTRADTGELVEERPFSAFETQMALNYGQPTEVIKPKVVTKKDKPAKDSEDDGSGIVDDDYNGEDEREDLNVEPGDVQ